MRKFLSMVVVTAVAAAGMPLSALAAGDESISVVGSVYRTNMQPIAKAEVQIRDLKTGYRVNSTLSEASGKYEFKALRPGTYVVEVVDRSGKVLGMSAPFVLGSAPSVNVSVVAVAEGAAASGGHAGFSLFGLGPVTSLAVIGAAGAAAVTAVVATRPDASPSR
jgi:hypothetical protein